MPEFGNPFSGLAKERKLTDSAEYEAIQLYLQRAESTDDQLAIDVLQDIADEERVHAGEFLRLLHELAPDEQKLYDEGTKEVQEMIDTLRRK